MIIKSLVPYRLLSPPNFSHNHKKYTSQTKKPFPHTVPFRFCTLSLALTNMHSSIWSEIEEYFRDRSEYRVYKRVRCLKGAEVWVHEQILDLSVKIKMGY